MTVLEYFDYEKQLLRDYDNVKTPHARKAVYQTLIDTLDTHKSFVYNTISSFEESIKQTRIDAESIQKGETPKYVKDMMAEFGFRDLEEDSSPLIFTDEHAVSRDVVFGGAEKPKKRRGRPRKAEQPKPEDKPEQPGPAPKKRRGRPRKAEQRKPEAAQ